MNMKKLATILLLVATFTGLKAQDADKIVGTYRADYANNSSRIKIEKAADGTYFGKAIWVKDCLDKDGNKVLDKKNPDKSLRSIPVDRIKILWNLKYNAEKNNWEGGKIYDPTRGIRANATINFQPNGKLRVRGSVMGIGESVYWDKLD